MLYVLIASATKCAVCKSIVSAIDELLDDANVDKSIVHVISKVCKHVPVKSQNQVN